MEDEIEQVLLQQRSFIKKHKLNACLCAGLLFFIAIMVNSASVLAQSATARVITTVVGNGTVGYAGDGTDATSAKVDSPSCLAFDVAGNLYINDQRNSCVRKVNTTGVISTIAGTGVAGYNGDNIIADTAKLGLNWGIATDGSGNVYINDQLNARVRKVNTGGIITTIAGTGLSGFSGDSGPATAAKIGSPMGIAVDGAGNIYVGDLANSRIRKISPSGMITTIAGTGTYGSYGNYVPATTAQLGYVFGLATDASGNVFFCDAPNNCIRKIDAAGIISTVAGTGTAGYSGDGGQASAAMLDYPLGVHVSSSGTLYIADYRNDRIREVSPTGIISTIAGTGVKGYNGDDIPATSAQLFHPVSVIADNSGDVYITDMDNVRIRKIKTVNTLAFAGGRYQNLAVCENTIGTASNELLTITDHAAGYTDTWSILAAPMHGTIGSGYSSVATGGKDKPSGMSYIPATGYVGFDTFTVRVSNGALSDTTIIYVTVSDAPSAGTISGNEYVCVRSIISLSASVSGGVWSATNKHAAVDKGNVTGAAAGLDTIIYRVTNACGMDTVMKPVLVRGLPDAGIVTGTNSFCNLSMTQLSDNVSGGYWTSSNTMVATVNSSGLVTGVNPGKVTITYNVPDNYCIGTAAHSITIDAYPNAGIITGPQHICLNSATTLADAAAGGTWKAAKGNATVDATGSVTGSATGADTISYSITNSCGTSTALFAVTVEPVPEIPVISRRADTCTVAASYASYQWTVNGNAIPGATASIYNVTSAGNYLVTVSNAEGCKSTSASVLYPGCSINDILIFPNPVASTIYVSWCENTTIKLLCMNGKELKTMPNTNKMDVADLPNGVYLLHVYDEHGNNVQTKKITKLAQ